MFRKLTLAIAATVALGTASLAIGTTPAEAKKGFHGGGHGHFHKGGHGHKHWHGHRHIRFYGPAIYAYGGGCYVKRWVATPWGLKLRWVNRCY